MAPITVCDCSIVLVSMFSIDKVVESKKAPKAGARVLPPQILPGVGVDSLRLWAATSDYTSEVSVGRALVERVHDLYKKFRLFSHYALGCISDFDTTYITIVTLIY
jgi:isoleucyl-tRNA synthetase